MHHITRRFSPSLIVASVALVMSLGGTAIAQSDILITDPSQLKDGVVTSTKVAPESVSNLRLRDPQLKVRVKADATRNGAGDGTVKRATAEDRGVYDVTFDAAPLNGGTGKTTDTIVSENCAITATARSAAAPPALSLDSSAVMFNMRTIAPNTVRVIAKSAAGPLIDTAFDIMASC